MRDEAYILIPTFPPTFVWVSVLGSYFCLLQEAFSGIPQSDNPSSKSQALQP